MLSMLSYCSEATLSKAVKCQSSHRVTHKRHVNVTTTCQKAMPQQFHTEKPASIRSSHAPKFTQSTELDEMHSKQKLEEKRMQKNDNCNTINHYHFDLQLFYFYCIGYYSYYPLFSVCHSPFTLYAIPCIDASGEKETECHELPMHYATPFSTSAFSINKCT